MDIDCVIMLKGTQGQDGFAYHDVMEGWIATILPERAWTGTAEACGVIMREHYSTWKGMKTIMPKVVIGCQEWETKPAMGVNPQTRRGNYLTVRKGLTVAVFFVGEQSNDDGKTWTPCVELVGP